MPGARWRHREGDGVAKTQPKTEDFKHHRCCHPRRHSKGARLISLLVLIRVTQVSAVLGPSGNSGPVSADAFHVRRRVSAAHGPHGHPAHVGTDTCINIRNATWHPPPCARWPGTSASWLADHFLWVLVWTGACYWHGVGGFMFNSSSSPHRTTCFRLSLRFCAK